VPKSKSKPKQKGKKSRKEQDNKKGGTGNLIALAAVVLAVAGGAYYWLNSGGGERAFLKSAAVGKSIQSRIKTIPTRGGGHLRAGRSASYPSIYPTSGPHDSVGTRPGFYTSRQRPEKLVHAIEHGNIVIYYDKPGDGAMEALRSWTALYSGPWSGVVATPMAGIGKSIVLTAWTKRLTLAEFDRAAAAAFIDLFRGRGPENRVR